MAITAACAASVCKLPQDGIGVLFEAILCELNVLRGSGILPPLEDIPELLVSFLTPPAEVGVFESNLGLVARVEESVEGIPLRFGVVFEHWCGGVACSGTGVDMAEVEVGVLHAGGCGCVGRYGNVRFFKWLELLVGPQGFGYLYERIT